jgi:DHA2 family multidrug resistance protein
MSRFSSFVPQHVIVRTGLIQGFGLGFIFVPLSTIAFSTLQPAYRTEAAGLYSLMRNLGSSVGVSVVATLLSKSTQINHSYLSENITPYATGVAQHFVPQEFGSEPAAVFGLINRAITKQAATIGYINDFSFMMWIAILAMPLVLLLRNPHKQQEEELPELIVE